MEARGVESCPGGSSLSSFVRPDAGQTPYRESSLYPTRSWRAWLFGRPLSTADAPLEAIGKRVGPLAVGQDQIVAQIVEIGEPRLPEFDETRERVTRDWVAEESKRLARQRTEEVLKVARQDGDLAAVARRYGLNIAETGPFTFFSPAPALGNNRELVTAALALTPEHPLAADPFEVGGNIVLMQLRSREPASEEKVQNEKDALAERLLQAKQESVFQRWLTSLRQQADIKVLQKL